MIRKTLILFMTLILTAGYCRSQAFIKTSDLLKNTNSSGSGNLIINQDSAIDSLISRYVISKGKLRTREENTPGMEGYRIQIYYSSIRTAREEAAKIRGDFMSKFPEIISYPGFVDPGWFMVRAGDYRTKAEGYKDLVAVRKEFPNAYLVPTIINFPDLIKK
jgi:hypothetical protein